MQQILMKGSGNMLFLYTCIPTVQLAFTAMASPTIRFY